MKNQAPEKCCGLFGCSQCRKAQEGPQPCDAMGAKGKDMASCGSKSFGFPDFWRPFSGLDGSL